MAKIDTTNPVNIYQRIHLAKEKDSTESSCKVITTFSGIVVANDHNKVTCGNCRKIIEANKRSARPR